MSEQPAEHCGHDCCDTPNMPFHDHFLDVDECPDCHSYREKVRELRERATALSGEVAQAMSDTPEQIVDVGPEAWRVLNAAAAFGHAGGSALLLRDFLAAAREAGWSLVRLDDAPLIELHPCCTDSTGQPMTSPAGAVVSGNGECAEFLLPVGDYRLIRVPVGSGDTEEKGENG